MAPPNNKGFKPSDLRRVLAAIEDKMPSSLYEPNGRLEANGQAIVITVRDPQDDALVVCSCCFNFDERALGKQPRDSDIETIAAQFAADCTGYPAKKAADAAINADRWAIDEARRAARNSPEVATEGGNATSA